MAVMLWTDEPLASAHLALAMLGSGAYSIDAWLFGRQVFVVSPGKEPDAR